MKFDICIVGGGVAGLSCGLLISSAIKMYPKLSDKRIVIFDDGKSDLKKARLYNAPGLPIGIDGNDALDLLHKQLDFYGFTTVLNYEAKSAKRTEKQFEVSTLNESIVCEYLVLASGFKNSVIDSVELEQVQHSKTKAEGRYQINNNSLQVADKLFVCGNLAGYSTQFAIAAGLGQQVGIAIVSEYLGSWQVIHDRLKND